MKTACFLALLVSLSACSEVVDLEVPDPLLLIAGNNQDEDDHDGAQEPCGGIPRQPPRVGGWQPCEPGEAVPQPGRLGCYVPKDLTVGMCTLSCETQLDCGDLWVHQQYVPDCDQARLICVIPCSSGECPDGMTCHQVQAMAICTWDE